MPEMNLSSVTTTNMTDNVTNYSVAKVSPDSATGAKETEYMNTKASQYFGYYKKIPELKKAIDTLSTWVVGKGYETEDAETQVILEHITGWGEDTFNSIAWNLFCQKKIYGDAFAEIIKDEDSGDLINLKPLDPAKIKIIADEKGIIKRYEQMSCIGKEGKSIQKFEPNEILHLCNDRVSDEIHGVSIIEACEEVILMKNEMMSDWRKVLHRNVVPCRIIECPTDDTVEMTKLKTQYETAINKGEVLIVPKGAVTITTEQLGNLLNPLPTINYCDNFFYRAVGVPKIVTGGSEEFTEASSKIAYLTFEQVYVREQTEFVADMWNQCQLKIKLNKPVSLQNELLTDESKDAGQLTMQPNDMIAGRGA